MSVYFIPKKGWRYDFTLKGTRYTGSWFQTRTKAKNAETDRRREVDNPKIKKETPTGMGFLELVNKRLDHVKAYNSESHYRDHIYLARRWVKQWSHFACGEISTDMIERYVLRRSKVSAYTANRDLRCLRALFNFGLKRKLVQVNPTYGIPFLPVEKRLKYIPPKEDVLRVIMTADRETQDYVWTLKETMARMSEVNRLTWDDVDFRDKTVILYTRKKRGGHLTPRKIPMTSRLYQVLSRRYEGMDKTKPWVFWHRFWDIKKKQWVEGPYKERKRIMRTLCKKAGVRYFRFHPLRHQGASILDGANVGIGSIQRILGHESRTTTEIYLHSIGEAEREAMRIFERVSENSHTDSHIEKEKGSVILANPLN